MFSFPNVLVNEYLVPIGLDFNEDAFLYESVSYR